MYLLTWLLTCVAPDWPTITIPTELAEPVNKIFLIINKLHHLLILPYDPSLPHAYHGGMKRNMKCGKL